jgi:hypothetical protein
LIFRTFLTDGSKTKVIGGTRNAFAHILSNLGTQKKVLLVISIPIVLLVIRFITIPACVKSEWALAAMKDGNHATKNNDNIDVSKVTRTIIYSGFFSGDKSLDSTASQNLLKLVLSSDSYVEGEWGTPDYSKTLYYQDVNGNVLGKTLFDEIGQTRTNPSTEQQTKFGKLSKGGLKKVREFIIK